MTTFATIKTLHMYKQPREETTFGIDLSGFREIIAGETPESIVVECTIDGESAPGIIVDDELDGNEVRIRVQGGDHGDNYVITVLVTTNAGHVRQADVVLRIREVV